ncbi:MAG: ERAP1-like C-terminal domain-containing protein, partial [Micromonosporaceae bacterium]
PSTHPISSNVPDTARALLNFDGISYAKGASALRQLVTWLGEDAFFAGLNDYFSRHQYGNASLADLLESLSRHTERDLVTWSDRWLRTAQVNTVHSKVATTPEGRLASVELAQTAPAAYPTLRPHRLAVGLYDHDGSSVRRRAQVLVDLDPRADGGRTPVPELIGEPVATLLLPNDGDLTYAKIRLDDRSWDNACEVLYRVDDSLTRAMLWSVAWDMVRDAEFPAARYLGLVAVHLPYETSSGIFETVLGTARRQAIDWYTPLNGRTAALDALAAVCRKALAGADSGSSTQLVAAHGLSRCATSAGDLATVNGWLAGSDVPEGLDVGPDLRWSVLLRLVVAAVAGPAEIDAELARDPSDEGERGATRCRAALPDPDVKAAAWASMMDDDSLSPYLLQATAEGFWQPEQATVLAPYLPRYFAELLTVTARRGSPEMDRMLCTYGFPRYAVGTDVVAWVEKLLARDDLTPVAARFLTDELDRLRRVLAARVAG